MHPEQTLPPETRDAETRPAETRPAFQRADPALPRLAAREWWPHASWAHASWHRLRASWFWGVVMFPFLLTRLAWILAATFARGSLQPNPTYLKYFNNGGQYTRIFLLDIFAHWDTRFYLSIIQDGYWNRTDLTTAYSNVAFFPLYPYLVKSIGWLGIHVPTAGYLAIGILLSNLCFLASAAMLYYLATRHLNLSPLAARRALVLLFVFPASFYFSSFYTESLFLFLSLLGFLAALERRWWLAGVAAGLVVLTRAQGVVVVVVLAWLYMEARGWRLREIRADAAWFGLAPLTLLAHFYSIYRLTGHLLAPLEAHVAWGREKYGLLQGLWLQLNGPALDVFKIDALLTVFFLGCGVYMFWHYRSKAYGLYTILLCLMPISTGLLVSVSRFLAVVFPVFLLLGEKLERREGYQLLCGLWFTLQVLYFAAWANFYWIA